MSAARFFSSLPADSLSPLETTLRQNLLDWCNSSPQPFPLTEWIDRRIGGEIETINEGGKIQICLRGKRASAPPPPAPKVTPAAFFAKLPQDSFSKQEEGLRESIFEFLATWKSQALATVPDLLASAVVTSCALWLPREVPLSDWIERRIGAEIELKKERGIMVVHVTAAAMAIVKAKFQKLASGGGKGAPPPPAPAAPPMDKEAFFASLPGDDFPPGEVALRQAILDFIAKKGNNRSGTLSDMMQDAGVQRCRSAFIPAKVAVRDWIERRIGGEVEIRKGEQGHMIVCLRGAAPPPVPPAGASGPKKHGGGADAWLKALPADELTELEDALRAALLENISNGFMLLTDLQRKPAVARASSKLLPSDVPLSKWINSRIGGELALKKDGQGCVSVAQRGVASNEAANHDQGDTRDSFFATLPEDEFTDAEANLREALVSILESWKGSGDCTLSHATGQSAVQRAKRGLIPNGCPVTVKEWIDRRIGGEIETSEDSRSGSVTFWLRGRGSKRRRM